MADADEHPGNDNARLPASEGEDAQPDEERGKKPNSDAALSGAAQQQGGAALGNIGGRKGSELFREDD